MFFQQFLHALQQSDMMVTRIRNSLQPPPPGMDHFLHDLVASFLLQRHVVGMLRGNGWWFLCCYLCSGEVGSYQHEYHVDRNQDISNHGDNATTVCTYTYRWWNGDGSSFGIYCIDCGGRCYHLAVLFGQCQGADKRG